MIRRSVSVRSLQADVDAVAALVIVHCDHMAAESAPGFGVTTAVKTFEIPTGQIAELVVHVFLLSVMCADGENVGRTGGVEENEVACSPDEVCSGQFVMDIEGLSCDAEVLEVHSYFATHRLMRVKAANYDNGVVPVILCKGEDLI